MKHRIDKINLELNINDKATDAKVLNNTVVEPFKSEVIHVIQTVLEQFSVKEKILIEQIKIEIGTESEEAFLSKLKSDLATIISKEIEKNAANKHSDLQQFNRDIDMLHFLAVGFFRNKVVQEKWLQVSALTLFENEIFNLIDREFASFIKQLSIQKQMRIRLVHYFPKAIEKVKQTIEQSQFDSFEIITDVLKLNALLLGQSNLLLSDLSCNKLMQFSDQKTSLKEGEKTIIAVVAQMYISGNFANYKNTKATAIKVLKNIEKENSLFKKTTNNGQEIKSKYETTTNDIINKKNNNLLKTFTKENLAKDLWNRLPTIDTDNFTNLLFNVGVIFFHPFLLKLFQELGLMNDRKFATSATKIKAVIVLKEISCGNKKATEQDLLFYKIICGLEHDFFIEPNQKLSKKERVILTKNLDLFLKEWFAEKSISIDTIRQHFFTRQGNLQFDTNQITVTIPSATFDVLLENYPWNRSVIKFPWLQKLIILKIET